MSAPLLVVPADPRSRSCLLPLLILVGPFVGFPLMVKGFDLPWPTLVPNPLLAACLAAAAFVTLTLIEARHAALTRAVHFHDDRIVFSFTPGRTSESVAWTELAGYRDGDARCVRLVERDGWLRFPPHLLVPTRDDAERAAVLALLDRKGLRRLDA